MKISLYHRGAPTVGKSWRADLRPDVSPLELFAAQRQIHRFGRMHRQVAELTRLNGNMTRSYDAAISTKFNADFRGTYASANGEMMTSDYTVRARARTICKDTPQGRAALRADVNNVVGHDPFKLDMRFGQFVTKPNTETGELQETFEEDTRLNRAIEDEWEIFGQPENFTITGQMSRMEAWQIAEASAFRDGFVILRHQNGFPYNPYGYAIELLECDRLQSQYMGRAENGNPIRFSIEYDKRWNRPVALYLLTRHPGDIFGQSDLIGADALATDKIFRQRISMDQIILFNNLRTRAEQDIGFTELDACVQSLWRLFQYEKALTYAAISSCMKPYWIKKNFPTGMQFTSDDFAGFMDRLSPGTLGGAGAAVDGDPRPDAGVVARQQGITQRVSTDVPGSTLDLDYGMELMQTDPRFPIEAAHEFRQDNQRDIAVGSGASYQDISGDFQNLGFAAALMSQTPKQDQCKVRQQNFIDHPVRKTFREWLRYSILSGVFEKKYGLSPSFLKLEDYVQGARFKGKRWQFVNPLVQAQTLIILMEANVMSPQQVQDQLPDGISVEDLYTQIAEAKAEAQKRGVAADTYDVTRPTISKGEPGEVAPLPPGEQEGSPAQATPKTKPANPVRRRARIAPEVMALIESQGDGRNGNGHH